MGWLGDFVEAHTVEVLAGMTALGGALSQAAQWVWAQWQVQKKEDETSKAEATLAIQGELQRIPDETASLRAFLVKLERRELQGHPEDFHYYLTVVQEARAAGVEPISPFWQNIRVPDSYIQALLRPLLDGKQVLHVDRESLGFGEVRDQWIVSGVHSSSLFVVYRNPSAEELWYVVIHHAVPSSLYLDEAEDEETSVTTTRTRHTMAMASGRIASLVQEIR